MKELTIKIMMVLNSLLASGEGTGEIAHESIQQSTEALTEIVQQEYKHIDIWYIYSVKGGSYWIEPSAEFENVIWVSDESLHNWGIDKNILEHGEKFSGKFDITGWELLGMEEIGIEI